MTPLPESRIRANKRYADKALRKMTFAFNRNTDADVLDFLDQSPNKRNLILTALREYARNHKENQPR